MLTSVILKRSLTQIGRPSAVSPATRCVRSVTHRFASFGVGDQAGGTTETHRSNSNSNRNRNSDHQNNGTIQFQMTPHHEFGSASHRHEYEYGSAPIGSSENNPEDHFGAELFLDQTAAAEQMVNIMENSYYFASYKAGGSQVGIQRSR
eukprot:jgi/Psemu1/20720/gm1.20720_g